MHIVKHVDLESIPHGTPYWKLFQTHWKDSYSVFFVDGGLFRAPTLVLSVKLIQELGRMWVPILEDANLSGIRIAMPFFEGLPYGWYPGTPGHPIEVIVVQRNPFVEWVGDENVVEQLGLFLGQYLPIDT